MTPDLLRRQQATQATQDKYRGRLFDWKRSRTCIHLLRSHLRAMGHKVPKVPPVTSAVSARRVMDAQGWKTCADLIDGLGLERIAPAMMLPGDVAYRWSEDGFGGVLICVGPHKVLGWFDNEETEGKLVVMDMSFDQLEAAWRA